MFAVEVDGNRTEREAAATPGCWMVGPRRRADQLAAAWLRSRRSPWRLVGRGDVSRVCPRQRASSTTSCGNARSPLRAARGGE